MKTTLSCAFRTTSACYRRSSKCWRKEAFVAGTLFLTSRNEICFLRRGRKYSWSEMTSTYLALSRESCATLIPHFPSFARKMLTFSHVITRILNTCFGIFAFMLTFILVVHEDILEQEEGKVKCFCHCLHSWCSWVRVPFSFVLFVGHILCLLYSMQLKIPNICVFQGDYWCP